MRCSSKSRTQVYLAKAATSLLWLELVIVFLIALALLVSPSPTAATITDHLEYKARLLAGRRRRPTVFALAALGAGCGWRWSTSPCSCRRSRQPRWWPRRHLGGFFISSVLRRLTDQLMGEGKGYSRPRT
jgi:hypothetical protein